MKLKPLLMSLSLFCITAVQADMFTLVPFKEYSDTRSQVFSFFDSLQSYNAYIVADDEQFLGKISRSRYQFDSLNNDWGSYGNSYSRSSIFNEASPYGSNYSDLSPFNAYALRPPTLRYKQNGQEYVAGYLTRNAYYIGTHQVANIDPCCLCDWIRANERCQ